MVKLDKAVIASLKRDGHTFEVLVDPELALKMRAGKQVSMHDLLAVEEIWKDSQKGLKCSNELLEGVFNTADKMKVARAIVTKGDVQVPTEIRRKQVEQRKKQVANMISRNALDPRNKTPHPPERILRAMDKAGVHVDTRPASRQFEEVVDALREILPLSFEKVRISVKVPAKYTGPAYGIIKQFTPQKENWLNNGDYQCELELSAAARSDFYDKINSVTHGEAQVKELE